MTTRAPAVLKKIDQRLTMFLKRLVIGLLWQLIEMYLFKEITLNKVIPAILILVIFIILKLRAVSPKKKCQIDHKRVLTMNSEEKMPLSTLSWCFCACPTRRMRTCTSSPMRRCSSDGSTTTWRRSAIFSV